MGENSNQLDIDQFLKELLSGDKTHYEALKRMVETYLRRHDGNSDHRDLISDIVGAIYGNLKEGRFRGETTSSFYAYVYAICSNSLKNEWKRGKRISYTNETPEPVLDRPSTLSAKYAKKELSEVILEQMDEKCRELLELKFKRNLSDQEVADHLGKTKNAVSTAISRCIRKAQELDIIKELL